MVNRPEFNKSFLDIYKSTKRGYPPKDTQLFWADSFLAGEHFNKINFGPLKDGFNLGNNPCNGRVLRPLSQVEWPSGDGGQPKDGDVKEFQTKVSGAVGDVIYYMDPFWDEINDAGDKATIDEAGLITLDEGVCQGQYPPWIIYWVCDDCGCSSGTIWLEDSAGDCLDCEGCDCDSGDDCVADCCMTESGTPEEMDTNDTKQFTCGGGGFWSISGTGGTIDQTGLVTTDGSACGILTISNTVCTQDSVVRVQGAASDWIFVSSHNNGCGCSGSSSAASISGGFGCGSNRRCAEVGEFRYELFAQCWTAGGECGSPTSLGPITANCTGSSKCLGDVGTTRRWGCI